MPKEYKITLEITKVGGICMAGCKVGQKYELSPITDAVREELVSLTRRLDVPYVFYDPKTGKPYQDVKSSFKGACRRAGIKDFRFHDLRHTFASHLVMGGVDLTSVKVLLGHKTINMTMRYAHLASSHTKKAIAVLDEKLNDKSTAQLLHSKRVTSLVDDL